MFEVIRVNLRPPSVVTGIAGVCGIQELVIRKDCLPLALRVSRGMTNEASVFILRYAGAVIIGATSVIGPVQLGLGQGDDGTDSFFLTVGRQFGSLSL